MLLGHEICRVLAHQDLSRLLAKMASIGIVGLEQRPDVVGVRELIDAVVEPFGFAQLIPRDLEPAALTIFASEQTPGNANNDVNPDVEPGTTADARLQAG